MNVVLAIQVVVAIFASYILFRRWRLMRFIERTQKEMWRERIKNWSKK